MPILKHLIGLRQLSDLCLGIAMGSMVEHNPVVELNSLDPGMPVAASPHSRIPTTPWSPRHGADDCTGWQQQQMLALTGNS